MESVGMAVLRRWNAEPGQKAASTMSLIEVLVEPAPAGSGLGDVRLEFGQPDIGTCIGRGAPGAPRRQRAARRYLGPVGQGRALELVGEEAPQEKRQPVTDLLQAVSAFAVGW